MRKLFLIVLFVLSSCSQNSLKHDFNFSRDMNFDDFKIKLKEYAKNNPYPNITD